MRDSHNLELAHLKNERREITFYVIAHFLSYWFGTFSMLSCTTGSLVGHENTQRGWYVAIDTNKFIVFEI